MSNLRKRLISSKTLMILALVLLTVIYGLRIINLDQDLPPWGVAIYQPKDEGCYAILAINEMEYGTINPESPADTGLDFPMFIQEHTRINIVGNILHILSFQLFGDNYFGLRMPMILIGFLNLLLLGVILLELRRSYGRKTDLELWGIIGILFLMSMHFYYYLSSRTVEPSTLRMLFAQLTMLIWLKSRKKGFFCFFCMGMCITISVFLVYITNVFLYLAVGLLLLMIWRTDGFRIFIKYCCAFVLGITLMFALAEVYYWAVWKTSAIINLLGAIGAFSGISGYEISGASTGVLMTLRGFVKNAARYFSANFFLYAPAILGIVLMLLPLSVWQVLKGKDKTGLFILAVPFSFLLQTMFSEDYIWRKLMVIAPYAMYFIFWATLNRNEFALLLKQYRRWYNSIRNGFLWLLAKLVAPVYIICSVAAVFVLVVFRLYLTGDGGKYDFASTDQILILLVGYLPVAVWGLMSIAAVFRRNSNYFKISICLLGCGTLLLSLCLLYTHVWKEPTFEERDMMISLSEDFDLDGKYVIGDVVMGITLYNDLKPVMDRHTNYGIRTVAYPDIYLFHYIDDSKSMRSYLDGTLYGPVSDYFPERVSTVPGTLQVNGVTRDFALYKAKPRSELTDEQDSAEIPVFSVGVG